MSKFYTEAERQQLIEDHMHLVPKVAFKYKDVMSMDELVAAGNLGLIRGIDKYDPSMGYKVSTYVVNWIRAEILAALYENRNVHIPWNKINSAIKRRADLQTNKEVAQDLQQEDLVKVEMSLDKKPSHFYADFSEDDENPIRNKIEVTTSLSAETTTSIEQMELRQHLDYVMTKSNLTEPERLSLVYRFGLSGEGPKSIQEVADILNYSRMGAYKLQKRALTKLRKNKLILQERV